MSNDISNCIASRSLSNQYPGIEMYCKARSTEVTGSLPFVWMLRSISAIAVILSVYLAWVAFSTGKVAGCGGGNFFDCSPILRSKWSTLFGVPISVPAIVLYATVLGLLMVPSTLSRISDYRWSLISFAAFTAGLSAIWFIGLQFIWLRHLCPYCLGVHACGLVMMGLIAWMAPAGRSMTWRLAALATLPVGLLIVSQISMPERENFELFQHDGGKSEVFPASTIPQSGNSRTGEDVDQIFESPLFTSPLTEKESAYQPNNALQLRMGIIALLNPSVWLSCQTVSPSVGQALKKSQRTELGDSNKRRTTKILNDVALDVGQWPLLGKPDAKYVFVEMLDYTCQHCQNTHTAIRGAMERYGDELAVIVLPVPLNVSCNAHVKTTHAQHSESCLLAKVAIAVWHLEPEKFGDYHNWLFESKATYAVALNHAALVVGEDRLRMELQSTVPSEYIAKIVELYRRAGAGAVPKIMFSTTSAVGEMRSASTLITLIEKQLGKAN